VQLEDIPSWIDVGGMMVNNDIAWRKSTFSQGGDCLEWVIGSDGVYIRDSKDPAGARLSFTHSEWKAFIAGVKGGEADLGRPGIGDASTG